MRRFEVRITIASSTPGTSFDYRSVEALLEALEGRSLSLAGRNGRRLHVVSCREDPTPSSARAIIAVVEEES